MQEDAAALDSSSDEGSIIKDQIYLQVPEKWTLHLTMSDWESMKPTSTSVTDELAEKLDETHHVLPGYVRHISVKPFYVFRYMEEMSLVYMYVENTTSHHATSGCNRICTISDYKADNHVLRSCSSTFYQRTVVFTSYRNLQLDA